MNPLRFLLLLCAVLAMSAVASASAQTRPALLGQHRSSLVNVIDRELLLKRGQGDAILMFTCAIDPRSARDTACKRIANRRAQES